jgi:hypothetical protein
MSEANPWLTWEIQGAPGGRKIRFYRPSRAFCFTISYQGFVALTPGYFLPGLRPLETLGYFGQE